MWSTTISVSSSTNNGRLYAVKIKSITDHCTASTLEDCWQDHYAEYPTGRESFCIKVRKVLSKAHIDVIPPAPMTKEPWLQLASIVDRNYLEQQQMKIRDYITDLWQESWDYNVTGEFYREL